MQSLTISFGATLALVGAMWPADAGAQSETPPAPASDSVAAEAKTPPPEAAPATTAPEPQEPAPTGSTPADSKPATQVTDAAEKGAEEDKSPYEKRLRVGFTTAFTQNEGVVGQQDGIGVTLGGTVTGQFNWRSGDHDWRNAVDYAVAFAYTSVIGQFVKTADRFQFDSTYIWKGLSWLGPYGRLNIDTPFFAGYDVRAAPVDYEITQLDESTTLKEQVTRLQLTSALEPLQFKESLGASLQALDTSYFAMKLDVGLTATQVLAEDALSLDDKKDTPAVEVIEIASYVALGQTTALHTHGELFEELVAYRTHAELFVPFVDTAPKTAGLPLDERINVSIGAKLSFRMATWAALEYELKALLQPQIQDGWQTQNVVLLSLGYDLLQ